MPYVKKVGPASNILLVTGSNIINGECGTSRKVRNLLDDDEEITVGSGSHDVLVTYAVPAQTGGVHCGDGLVGMPVPNGTDPDDLTGNLSTLLQEIGHRWLVPSDLKLKTGSGTAPFLTPGKITEALENDQEYPGPPLIGRKDSHWTPYFQADGSPMDGLYWADEGQVGRLRKWKTENPTKMTLSPGDGLSDLELSGYCDLDRYIMGVMDANEAYPDNGGKFRWLEPRLCAPLEYHIGLCVAFGPNDYVYFGFYTDHRKLKVERTGNHNFNQATIDPGYEPLDTDEARAVSTALRVVKRGDTYHFQANRELFKKAAAGCLSSVIPGDSEAEDVPDMFDGIDSLPQNPAENPDFSTFQTVATVTEKNKKPKGVGVIVETWNEDLLADGAFSGVQVKSGGTEHTLSTSSVPSRMTDLSGLPKNELRIDQPKNGDGSDEYRGIIQSRDGELHLVATYNDGGNFDHGTGNDRALKALTEAPSGDFAFGSRARVDRAIFNPWAGGYALGKTMWGTKKSAKVSDVQIPQHVKDKQLAEGDTHKVAFIIAAENQSDVSDAQIDRVDRVRRYFEEAFRKTTNNKVEAATILP